MDVVPYGPGFQHAHALFLHLEDEVVDLPAFGCEGTVQWEGASYVGGVASVFATGVEKKV